MITITQLRGRHWIKRGDMLHVTHYPSSGAAAQAARKITAGLVKFQPITLEIKRNQFQEGVCL